MDKKPMTDHEKMVIRELVRTANFLLAVAPLLELRNADVRARKRHNERLQAQNQKTNDKSNK